MASIVNPSWIFYTPAANYLGASVDKLVVRDVTCDTITSSGGHVADFYSVQSPDGLRTATIDITNLGIMGIVANQPGAVYRFGVNGRVDVLSTMTIAGDGVPAIDAVGDIRTAGTLYAVDLNVSGTQIADSYTVRSPDDSRTAIYDISNAGVVGFVANQAGAIYRFGVNGRMDVLSAMTIAGDGVPAIDAVGDIRTAGTLYAVDLNVSGTQIADSYTVRSPDDSRTAIYDISNAGVVGFVANQAGAVYRFGVNGRMDVLSAMTIAGDGVPAIDAVGDIRTGGIVHTVDVNASGTLTADSCTVRSPDDSRTAIYDISNAGVVGFVANQAGAVYRFGGNGRMDVLSAMTIAGNGVPAIDAVGDIRTGGLVRALSVNSGSYVMRSPNGLNTATINISNAADVELNTDQAGRYLFGIDSYMTVMNISTVAVEGYGALNVWGDIYSFAGGYFTNPVRVAEPTDVSHAVTKTYSDQPGISAIHVFTFSGAAIIGSINGRLYVHRERCHLIIPAFTFTSTSTEPLVATAVDLNPSCELVASTACSCRNTGTGSTASGISILYSIGYILFLKKDDDISFDNGSTYEIAEHAITYYRTP